MKPTRPPHYLVIEGSPFDNPVKLRWARMKKARRMHQILLRESELGRRYTVLGNFSKSADLKSLFTENSGESARVDPSHEIQTMWWRLNALACAPMQATGADSLLALAGSRRAARVHSRYGKRSRASATATPNSKGRRLWVLDVAWPALKR